MSTNFYIKSLLIQNFATFKNQSINFRPGFNTIVGETGSGKSLVLDALQIILGGRADKKIVRRDTDYSLLEATFWCKDENIKSFLEIQGFPVEGDELIIKRLIYRNGTSKAYINHLSCTLSFLNTLSRKYIDLVGQFENQKLLSGAYQLHLLDHFAGLLSQVKHFQELLRSYKEARALKEQLEQSRLQREQRLDYLDYQLQEIEKLNPSSQDEEDLLRKKNKLVNLEKTQKLSFQIKEVFEGSEAQRGLAASLKYLSGLLLKNQELCPGAGEVIIQIEEQIHQLHSHLENSLEQEIDAEEIEGVMERLDCYQKLKKKFGGSVETLLQQQVDFLKEKSQLEELEENLEDVHKDLLRIEQDLKKEGLRLHKLRLSGAKKLSQELTSRVRLLKMAGATVRIELEQTEEFMETGMSKARFTAETNLGEGFFPIKDIASGGELSRILLSVRQILSSYDSISIFLFDEIDTGIGGETANFIGRALQEVSSNGQVIAITHLPQIAQFADSLILVQKDIQQKEQETRTESWVREVVGKMILKEVKAMAQLQ